MKEILGKQLGYNGVINIRCLSMSADGYVTTPDGWPALIADPAFVSGQSTASLSSRQLRGRADGPHDLRAAIAADRWPWPNLDVRARLAPAERHPDEVVVESDPQRLLEQVRAANQVVMSISSAARAPSRPSAPSEPSTSSG